MMWCVEEKQQNTRHPVTHTHEVQNPVSGTTWKNESIVDEIVLNSTIADSNKKNKAFEYKVL